MSNVQEKLVNSSNILVIELSEYDKDLMQLREQCRRGELNDFHLYSKIGKIADKHSVHTKRVIADLFAC